MIYVDRRAGRLVEARFENQLTVPLLKEFSTSLAQIVMKASGRLVFIVDFRHCEPFDNQIEAMLLGQARSDNWVIERSSFLMRPGTTVCTQMERVITLAKNPARHGFTSLDDLAGWMSPMLSLEELQRLKAFVAERP